MPGKNGKRKQNISLGFLCLSLTAAFIFTADFFIKRYFLSNHPLSSIPVIKNILHLTVVFNRGAAFGLLRGETVFLIYTGIIFLLVFLFAAVKAKKKSMLFFFACGLITGGAFSNLYDRVFFGFVVDYIDIRVWPVFNLSDSAISVGAFILLFNEFRKQRA